MSARVHWLNERPEPDAAPAERPLDYVATIDDRDDGEPFAAQPMFTLIEKIFVGSLLAAAAVGFWIGWPS